MVTLTGDLFEPKTYSKQLKADAICITTNGAVKINGRAVMGRGCARQAAQRYTQIPEVLGQRLQQLGNRVHIVHVIQAYTIVSFPVKPSAQKATNDNVVTHWKHVFGEGKRVPGWACKAQLDIIKKSAQQLVLLTEALDWNAVVIPRPGCGAGELEWADVKATLSSILDDRFNVITFAK